MLWFVWLVVVEFTGGALRAGLAATTRLRLHWFREEETADWGGGQEFFCEKPKIFFRSWVMGHGSLVEDSASHWLSAGGGRWKLEGG